MLELSYTLELDESGVIERAEEEAANEILREWLAIPQGSDMDNPAWGNPLLPFKHEPPDKETARMMAMAIVQKAMVDIPQLGVAGISLEPIEFDAWLCVVRHRYGVFRQSVSI